VKKIRDESGAWIPATYKSKRYAQWKERSKVEENSTADGEDDSDNDHEPQKRSQLPGMFKMYFIDYIPYFSGDNAHLMYNAHPKLSRIPYDV
jgi:hypothetical protein